MLCASAPTRTCICRFGGRFDAFLMRVWRAALAGCGISAPMVSRSSSYSCRYGQAMLSDPCYRHQRGNSGRFECFFFPQKSRTPRETPDCHRTGRDEELAAFAPARARQTCCRSVGASMNPVRWSQLRVWARYMAVRGPDRRCAGVSIPPHEHVRREHNVHATTVLDADEDVHEDIHQR
eukprot:COSAG02_NODE_1513_length_12207_cov_3.820240_4_plen_179_part_00